MGTKHIRLNAVLTATVTIVLASVVLSHAQSESISSTYGQEFFLGFMSSFSGANLSVTVGTPGNSTRFTIETSNWSYNGSVTYGSPVVVYLPPELQITGSDFSNRQKAVHVYSQSRQKIFVLAESFVRNSHTAFLNYPYQPIEGLFIYDYSILSANDITNNFRSEFLLIGCEENTVISIVPSQNISLPEDPQISDSSMSDIEADGSGHQFVLNRMQTLLILSDDDLTGSLVVSNKPLTVISGHECVENLQLYPHSYFYSFYCFLFYSFFYNCEPLALQMHPTATWGTQFIMAIGQMGQHQEIKGLKMLQDFDVSITCGTGNSTYEANPSYPFSSNSYSQVFTRNTYAEYCYIESTEQAYIVHMSLLGDPAFAMVSPVDQYVHDIEFVTLPSSTFPSNYISITVLEEHFNPDGILLDGIPVDCEWRGICNGTTDYCYLATEQIIGYGCTMAISSDHLTPAQHKVAHSDPEGLLSVISCGFSLSPPQGYVYLTGQVLKTENIDIPSIHLINLSEFSSSVELGAESDGNSLRIDIPDGLVFGDRVLTSAYVNENGVISFKSSFSNAYPETFPASGYNAGDSFVVAPFWSDNDIRRSGSVRYINFSFDTSNVEIEGRQLMDEVNSFIQAQQDERGERFEGNWLLAAHWDHVHPSPHGEDISEIDEITNDLEMTNNYQAIIVSDTLTTHVIFTYECGEIQWSRSGSNAAVIGFSAGGVYYHNHPLSGSTFIREAVRCSGRNVTNMFFTLPTAPNARDIVHRQRCLRKYHEDRHFLRGTDISSLARLLESCPCTLLQAILDLGRYIRQSDTFCFVSSRPVSYDIPGSRRIQLTQQCCYDQYYGALIRSQNGLAGTMLLYDPIRYPDDHQLWDVAFRDACCLDFNSYCHKFFERRLINTCENYPPPNIGWGGGDPHYYTFDRRYHTFNGLGEFTLLEALQENNNTPIYNLQGRLGTVSFWRVTTHLGFAFGHQQLAFQFDGETSGFRVLQTRPGPVVDITTELVEGQLWYDETLEAVLVKDGQRLTVAFFESGVVFKANVYQYRSEYFMNFIVQVPRSRFQRRTRGFLGNLDDNRTNEFYRRGESIPITDHNLRDRQLYQTLNTWRTTEQESLFYYPSARRRRQTYENYQNHTFVPLFLDELNFTDKQRVACEGNDQCLFDLAVTGDMEFAGNTLNHEKDANRTGEELENFPPNISGNAVFRVNIGQGSTYFLSVTDPDDTVTVTVQGVTTNSSTLMKLEEGEYVFVLNLQLTFEPLHIVFVANDSRGAIAIFEPTVEICACANEGTCTRDGLITSNSTIIMNCQCNEAFSGPFCQEDRNGCVDTHCFEGVECMDVPAPGTGAVCGPCPHGYTEVSQKCYDIDECGLNSTLCDQVCTNTDGSYMCTCIEGYQLIEGTNHCQDINECEGINPCQQVCENTEGSYTCSCTEGFSLAPSNGTCTANEVCTNANECSHGCALVHGREQCFCPLGFELSRSGTQCIDVNECLRTPCGQSCVNTKGSFECNCMSGFELQPDRKTCQDIDECSETAQVGFNLCASDRNTNCINRYGSFECSCVPGYARVNGICQYIEQQPPPPRVAIDPQGRQNSINFTISTLSSTMFTPDQQQRFRLVTADIVSTYCSTVMCNLILSNGTTGNATERIHPMNVAIPVSLIGEDELGQLKFTMFIQVSNGYLSKEHLNLAIKEGEPKYRDAGFYQALPTTTMPGSSQPVPTLFPGLSEIYSYVIICVLALVVVILCAVIAIASYSCYYKQQHKKSQGKIRPLQLGNLYINESIDGAETKPQEETNPLPADTKSPQDKTTSSQPEDKRVQSQDKPKVEAELARDERNPSPTSVPQVETKPPKDSDKTWI